jgi:hypothetical protein
VPRGAAERPIRASDEEVGLRAALRQGLERGAAPGLPVRAPDADVPAPDVRVRETAPARAVTGVARPRGVRASSPPKSRRPGKPERERIPDPRGRGTALDLRV